MRVRWIVVNSKCCPNSVRRPVHGKAKGRLHYTDDGKKVAAEADTSSDDALVRSKLRHPQSVTDKCHASSRFFFVRCEAAAKLRSRSQRRQEIRGNDFPIHLNRTVSTCKGELI